MRFIVQILDFLAASNVYVSLAVVSLTFVSLDDIQIEHRNLLFFVFFATLFVYNFIRLVNVKTISTQSLSLRHQIIFKFRVFFWILCFVSALLTFYFFSFIYELIFYPLIILGIVSIVYGLPIFKNGTDWFRLRDVPGLKIFLIASIWAIVSQGLPDLMSRLTIDYLALFERFLFIFAITIPFDIRDLHFDKFNLATLPQYFGVRKARWMGIGALLIAEFILVYRFFFQCNLTLWGAITIYLTYELSAFLIYKSHPNLKERYTTIGVEGLPILMGLMFFFSQRVS